MAFKAPDNCQLKGPFLESGKALACCVQANTLPAFVEFGVSLPGRSSDFSIMAPGNLPESMHLFQWRICLRSPLRQRVCVGFAPIFPFQPFPSGIRHPVFTMFVCNCPSASKTTWGFGLSYQSPEGSKFICLCFPPKPGFV